MSHHCIKQKLLSAISDVVSDIDSFSLNTGKDFSRVKKLPPDKLIRFLISEGSSSAKNELLDFLVWILFRPLLQHFPNSGQSLNRKLLKPFLGILTSLLRN